MKQLNDIQPAPSVGMHDVPRESVGQHLGFGKDDEEGRDALDESVARTWSMSSYLICPLLTSSVLQNMPVWYITSKNLLSPRTTPLATRTTPWAPHPGGATLNRSATPTIAQAEHA